MLNVSYHALNEVELFNLTQMRFLGFEVCGYPHI
jgi:hypothetical protein